MHQKITLFRNDFHDKTGEKIGEQETSKVFDILLSNHTRLIVKIDNRIICPNAREFNELIAKYLEDASDATLNSYDKILGNQGMSKNAKKNAPKTKFCSKLKLLIIMGFEVSLVKSTCTF